MTDRSRTNPAPTAADERVIAAQRRLAGLIGHDLNNLLFVLEGNLDLMHDSLADDPGLATRASRARLRRSSGQPS